MKKTIKYFYWIGIFVLLFGLSACSVPQPKTEDTINAEKHTADFFAMDTYITMTVYDAQETSVLEIAKKRVLELEEKLNAEDDDSEIATLNHNRNAVLSQDAYQVLEKALVYWQTTEGAFNPAIHPLMALWGFPTGKTRVPTEQEVKTALALARPDKIVLTDEMASIQQPGVQIDLGGIAKGYTSSELIKLFRQNDIKSGLVNLGGNVQSIGCKPDGSPWKVGIQHPDREKDYLGILETQNEAVITSGGYERFFEENGATYHHIIDSSTGYPADNGLISVTIVSPDGTLADALSTALYVMGEEKALAYWQKSADDFEMILLTQDGRLLVTREIAARFETDMKKEIIEKTA